MISHESGNVSDATHSRAWKFVALCVAPEVDEEADVAFADAAGAAAASVAEATAAEDVLWLRSLRGAPDTEATRAEAKTARIAKRAIVKVSVGGEEVRVRRRRGSEH